MDARPDSEGPQKASPASTDPEILVLFLLRFRLRVAIRRVVQAVDQPHHSIEKCGFARPDPDVVWNTAKLCVSGAGMMVFP